MERTLSIGDTARITSISEKQLRHWEQQNYLNDIERITYGERAYRRYSEDQVKQIGKMKEYLDMGFTLSASARLAKENTEKGGE